MKGVYQHCAHNHLHRYLGEFDFRYNNRVALGVSDQQRADKLPKWLRRQGARLRNDYCLSMAKAAQARQPAQSRKSIEAAKRLAVDQSGEAFSKALDKLVPKKPSGTS